MELNYIQKLGKIAIASRLKQLTDVLMKDMAKVYKELHVDFEPRWFAFIHLLQNEDKLSLTEIAYRLNQSHVAANQVANILEENMLVEASKDSLDNRKRMLRLSKKGRKLADELEPVWIAVEKAVNELLSESDSNLFGEISKIEEHLQKKSMYSRVKQKIKREILDLVQIVNYKPVHKHAFIDLNLAWLEKYFEVEPHDQKLLFNPDEEIIGKGGNILMAQYRDENIGTAALLRLNNEICELTKMTVIEKMQSNGIGRKLLICMIELARNIGYQKMTLLTSTKLTNAMQLYRSAGFIESTEKSILLENLERDSIQLELKLIDS